MFLDLQKFLKQFLRNILSNWIQMIFLMFVIQAIINIIHKLRKIKLGQRKFYAKEFEKKFKIFSHKFNVLKTNVS